MDIASTFDEFIVGCTCSLIRNHQPDVTMIHVCDIDSLRHRNGVFSSQVKEGLERMDRRLGEIKTAMEDAGVYEHTDFVILSDHGQMDFERQVRMNVLLARGGFIDIAPDGSVYDWEAWSKSSGMSTTIYLKDSGDVVLRDRVYAYLKGLAAEGRWGIEAIYTAEELRQQFGTYGPFSFILEGDGKTAFEDAWNGTAERFVEDEVNPDYRSKHGYDPRRGPKPIFMGRGPGFKEGAIIAEAQLYDIAPTLASILGQEMPQAEGRSLKELLVSADHSSGSGKLS